MEVGKLTVQLRRDTGKGIARRLRGRGLVPGICYGTTMEQPLPIQLSPKELKGALDPQKRQNTVIEVTVEDPKASVATQTITAMLKEYQVHPIKRGVLHVEVGDRRVPLATYPLPPSDRLSRRKVPAGQRREISC